MFKFLHAADIHLDSPLSGLDRYEGAPVDTIREATRRALENMVDLALAEPVQFVLLAGDLYDGDWKDYNTGLFLVRQMNRLRDADIPVVVVTGNHDAANKMTRTLRLPDNMKMLGTDAPETHRLPEWDVAVHGQGFATPAITEDLSLRYPLGPSGCFNIGLLHTCAAGREGHERYAPCTVEGLLGRNYDYWALGHVHQRDVLHAEPNIIFPGNLQGRHIRERGAKGCMLVSVDDGGRATPEFRPLDVFRWEQCAVAADDADDIPALLDTIRADLSRTRSLHTLPRAVRVVVHGSTAFHEKLLAESFRWTNEVRALADDTTWIEKVEWNLQPERGREAWSRDGPLGELLSLLSELQHDPRRAEAKIAEMRELQELAKKSLPHTGAPLPWQVADELAGLLDEAGSLLTRQLFNRGITG